MFCTLCGKRVEIEPSMFCNHYGSRIQAPIQQGRSTREFTRNGRVPGWLWVIGLFAGFIWISALLNQARPPSLRADIPSQQQAQMQFPDTASDPAPRNTERVESEHVSSDSILSRDP